MPGFELVEEFSRRAHIPLLNVFHTLTNALISIGVCCNI